MILPRIPRPKFRQLALIALATAYVLAITPSQVFASSKIHTQPKLVVKRVLDSPSSVVEGGFLTISDQTKNVGRTPVKPSRTAYLLSLSSATTSGPGVTVLGQRLVPRLRPGRFSNGSLGVALSPSISAGVYHVIACANYRPKLKGRKSKRGCRFSPTNVTVTVPATQVIPAKEPVTLAVPCAPDAGSPVKGIDVSQYQGSINFTEVAISGVHFVFAKADQGAFVDPKYATYKKDAASAGLKFGAYQFFEPNQDPVTQANKFLADAALGPGNLIPVLDVESNGGLSPSALKKSASSWLQTVQASLGVKPLIYTDKSIWESDVEAGLAAEGYPLWVASWTAPPPHLPSEWSNWEFWQYSDIGKVPGISGPVDLDEFNGASPCTIG
jgi:lysozyme